MVTGVYWGLFLTVQSRNDSFRFLSVRKPWIYYMSAKQGFEKLMCWCVNTDAPVTLNKSTSCSLCLGNGHAEEKPDISSVSPQLVSEGSSVAGSSEQTLHGCFLTVSVAALVNWLAFYTVLHNTTDGRTEAVIGQQGQSEKEVCVLGRLHASPLHVQPPEDENMKCHCI